MRVRRDGARLVGMDDTTPIADTPIRTQADLEAFWRRLMEPLGFSDGTLWVLAIGGDDLPTPTLLEVVDEGVQPTPEEITRELVHGTRVYRKSTAVTLGFRNFTRQNGNFADTI